MLRPEVDDQQWKDAVHQRHVRGQDGDGNPVRLELNPGDAYWLEDEPLPEQTKRAIEQGVFIVDQGNEVSHPSHYTHLPVECIDVTEHFTFCLGNAIKYIWRADHKGKPIQDLEKAAWYIQREIDKRKRVGR